MNYYILENNKIVLFDENKERLQNTLIFTPQYQGLEIFETEREIIELNEQFEFKDEVEEQLAQQEKERIAKLKLTKREVFLGLYQAKGVTPDMIKAQITDPTALIEFEYASDYYRGNPLIDVVGAQLGITSEQLDKFFDTKDYTYLLDEVNDNVI